MTDTVQLDSNSKERVAFDLMVYIIRNDGSASFETKDTILDLFAECRFAAGGSRRIRG
jgi:hypothetical protein